MCFRLWFNTLHFKANIEKDHSSEQFYLFRNSAIDLLLTSLSGLDSRFIFSRYRSSVVVSAWTRLTKLLYMHWAWLLLGWMTVCRHVPNHSHLTNHSPVSAVSTRRHLRSAGQGDLVVPRTWTTGFGPWSFSVAGPLAWNSLPPEIKTTSLTLGQFCGQLKTEMFIRSYYASAQPS